MTDEDKMQIAKIELHQLRGRCALYEGRDILKLEDLFWKATGQGAMDYSKVRVQTSPVNSMERCIVEMVDFERKLAKDEQELRKDIKAVEFSPVLMLRYVYGYKWKDVAKKLNLSVAHVKGYLLKQHLVEYFNRKHNI